VIVVIMGVAGAGKSTVGCLLAERLGCPFLDGDSLHPAANVDKMAHGIPLTDADRAPWLEAIRVRLEEAFRRGENLVTACSALKQQYRDFLAEKVPVTWVYLKGTEAIIRRRLEQRREHYMKANMLASQFAALEEPATAIVADVSSPPELIVEQILADLRTRWTDSHVA
jgi:gluconokinase